jgi:hypothetical protein
MTQRVTTLAFLGASDTQDRNCRDWTLRLARELQVGKESRVRAIGFGYEGQGSPQWYADGHLTRLAGQRPDFALLSFFADGNPGLCPSLATNLANMYAAIDTIRIRRSDTKIYLLKMWRMSAAQEAISFPNLASVYAQYNTVVANRANISILDFYSLSGNPALHPDEWDPGDPIHPLLPWHQRVSIPTAYAAIEPQIT